MPVENQPSVEEQFAGVLLCRRGLRLRKLYSHFFWSILKGSGKLKTPRVEKEWLRTADAEAPFVKPLIIEGWSSFAEVLPLLILPSQ
jgi:hypothetical protein